MAEIGIKRRTRCGAGLLITLMLALSISGQAKVVTEKDWPRQIDAPKGTIIIYQPQLEMFNGADLKCRCAIAATPKGESQAAWGSLWIEAKLLVNRDTRLATIIDFKIPQARFSGSTPEQEKKLKAFIEEEVPKKNFSISLDRLVTGMQGSGRDISAQDRLNHAPPRIIVSEDPAVLVVMNGEAKLIKIPDTNLFRIANSPFQVVFDPMEKIYYLNGGSAWFATQDLRGAWTPVDQAPEELVKFYTFWTRRSEKIAPGAATANDRPPHIIAPFEPAELIVLDGPPQYQPVPGTDLFFAGNTVSDVFLDGKSRQNYVLLAGRWYKAGSLAGPWEHVASDQLPAGFGKIPADSPKHHVLAHVAGTELAQEAVLDTQIPQTAVISRRAIPLQVTYDGQPQFKPVEGLPMQYATNTESAVINVNQRFYCCDNAIWYESEKAQGPWSVCIAVPDTIYSMPPSCPLYNVKFVRVYKVMPDAVHVGYTPGYLGCYCTSSGTVVYGTGYTYPEWFQTQYIALPLTWGMRARYNPLTGNWGLFADYVSPGGKYRIYPGSVDGGGNRITKWSTAGWWGAGGYRDYLDVAGGAQAGNAVVSNNEERAMHNIYARYEAAAKAESIQAHVMNARFMEIKEATVPKANPDNVFVDRLGDVYRRTDDGWQKRQGSEWMDVRTTPASNKAQLDEEYRKRERGIERDRQYEIGKESGK